MNIANKIKSVGARLTMGEDDVRALLEKDHDEVKALLGALVDGEQDRSRQKVIETLKTNLVAHSRAEEQVVYDALIRSRAKQDVHVLAEEGYVEHGSVDDLLLRVSRQDIGSELWLAHVKAISELLEHHIAEEQSQVFAQLGDLFSRDELVEMGREFLRLKARVLTQEASKMQRNVARVVAGQRSHKATKRASAKKIPKKGPTAARRYSRSAHPAASNRAPAARRGH